MMPEKINLEIIFCHPSFEDPSQKESILGPIPFYDEYLSAKKKSLSKKKEAKPEKRMFFEEPQLLPEQEFHLFRKYNYLKWCLKAGNDEVDQLVVRCIEIRNQIVVSNLGLAIEMTRRTACYNKDDMLSEAFVDLILAVDRFDYNQGTKFSTYAPWIIKNRNWQRAKVELREINRISQDSMSLINKIESPEEDAIVTLERKEDQEFGATLLDHLAVDDAKSEALKKKKLDVMEKRKLVLRHRFGLGEFSEKDRLQTGEAMNISRERVRQLEVQAFEHIRKSVTVYQLQKQWLNQIRRVLELEVA